MNDVTSQFPSQFDVAQAPADGSVRRAAVRVWDLPTRVFHWALLCCVAGAVMSAQLGGNWMEWHVRFGACILGLLVFRLIWGFAGPRYARFGSFMYGPKAVLEHLGSMRGRGKRHAGHSPSGAVSVFALLGVLVAQATSGLFSTDEISTDGPLVRFASEVTVSLASSLHVQLQWAIYALMALHVAAVLFYLVVKKDDLIRPMLHGDKRGIRAPQANDSFGVRLAGMATMLGSVAGALWMLS